MVCTLLKQHSKGLEENPRNCQPGNHQPRGAKAKRQEGADQQPSAWPEPSVHFEGEGNAPDLLVADVTLRAAPGTALQWARAPKNKRRAASPLPRPEKKKPTVEYAAKLNWFQLQVLRILDRNAFMTFRAINKILKMIDARKSYNPTALWKRTCVYHPHATACSTRVKQPAFVLERFEYLYLGCSEICGKDMHFYRKKLDSFCIGSDGTGGLGSDMGDENESGGDSDPAAEVGGSTPAHTLMHGSSSNQGNGCAGGEEQDAMVGLMQDAELQIDGTAEAGAGSGGGAAGVESEAGSAAAAAETESQTAAAVAAAAAAAAAAAGTISKLPCA
jgi:hypothetical protein